MKRLLLFIEGRDWTLPIGVTIIALIVLVSMNVSASLTFDPAMREQLVIKQWFDTAGWLAVIFVLTTYVEWMVEIWAVYTECYSHHKD